MLIQDLDYSENIHSESRISGGRTYIYHYTKVQEYKAAPNGKGKTYKTISTQYKSGNAKAINLNSIEEYIKRVEKSIPVSLGSLWLNF